MHHRGDTACSSYTATRANPESRPLATSSHSFPSKHDSLSSSSSPPSIAHTGGDEMEHSAQGSAGWQPQRSSQFRHQLIGFVSSPSPTAIAAIVHDVNIHAYGESIKSHPLRWSLPPERINVRDPYSSSSKSRSCVRPLDTARIERPLSLHCARWQLLASLTR